ncbi:MAG: hypothetical protein ACLQVF_15400 [Isosphaeraceae bacterium]
MFRTYLLAFTILGLCCSGRSAAASAITYAAENWSGWGGTSQPSTVIPLPDLSTGGTTLVNSYTLNWGPGYAQPQVITQLTNPSFQFTIEEQSSSDSSTSPSLLVTGHINGTFLIAPGAPQPNFFNYSGEATSIQIVDPSGATIPQDLLDLATNPARIQVVGIGTEGQDSGSVQVYLTIDPSTGPPHAIPEPASLLTFAIPLAAFFLYKHLRRLRASWDRRTEPAPTGARAAAPL